MNIGSPSSSRAALRIITACPVARPPLTDTTRTPTARLPGVCPPSHASITAKYPTSVARYTAKNSAPASPTPSSSNTPSPLTADTTSNTPTTTATRSTCTKTKSSRHPTPRRASPAGCNANDTRLAVSTRTPSALSNGWSTSGR